MRSGSGIARPCGRSRRHERPPSRLAGDAQGPHQVEARSRELVYTTLFFALAAVLIFAFSFVRDGEPPEGTAAGILWVAIAFSGTLALGRAFEREREGETLRALLLAPIERGAVYLGKLLGLVTLMSCVEVVLVPVVVLLFDAPIGRAPWLVIALVVTGTLGFAAVGTLFAAMLVRMHSRDVLLARLALSDYRAGRDCRRAWDGGHLCARSQPGRSADVARHADIL